MSTCLLRGKLRNSSSSLMTLSSTRNLLMHLLHPFGSATMSRRGFFASFSVDAAKNFLRVAEVVSEVKLTSSFVVILQLPNLNYFSMFTRLPQEVFILLVKVLLPSVSLFTSLKTQRLVKLSLKVELLFCQTAVFAASTSSTRWTTALESSFTKLWSSRLFQSLKPVSSVL